jgi:hypothetical protein
MKRRLTAHYGGLSKPVWFRFFDPFGQKTKNSLQAPSWVPCHPVTEFPSVINHCGITTLRSGRPPQTKHGGAKIAAGLALSNRACAPGAIDPGKGLCFDRFHEIPGLWCWG